MTKQEQETVEAPAPIDESTIAHLAMVLDVLADTTELDAVLSTTKVEGRTKAQITADQAKVQGLHWLIIRTGDRSLLARWERLLDDYLSRARPFDWERNDWWLETNQTRLTVEETGQSLLEGVPDVA